jgi:hypothetical protein
MAKVVIILIQITFYLFFLHNWFGLKIELFLKKKEMLKIIPIVLFFISLNLYSQDSTNIAKKYFAISLQPNFQGIVTYAIVEINKEGKVVNRIFMKRQDWLLQMVGMQKSIANPEGKNLMKEAGIEGPEILDDLWKLRYGEAPYEGTKEKGWAAKARMPSEGQMQMLAKFGIRAINDYVYGQALLDLLNAMEDPGWVSEYQNK